MIEIKICEKILLLYQYNYIYNAMQYSFRLLSIGPVVQNVISLILSWIGETFVNKIIKIQAKMSLWSFQLR